MYIFVILLELKVYFQWFDYNDFACELLQKVPIVFDHQIIHYDEKPWKESRGVPF